MPVPPGKVGGSLQYLMLVREEGSVGTSEQLARVFAMIEKTGGVDVDIWFDHILSDEEIADLEKTFDLRFLRANAKVPNTRPTYSVTIPWEQIVPVANLPYVKSVETSLWPPPGPAK